MKKTIVVETPVEETPRVAQVRGMFDLIAEDTSRVEWDVELPLEGMTWNVGLIVGPSGCGKSTLAHHIWPESLQFSSRLSWSRDRTVLDDFDSTLPVKELISLLSSVGFSSPPAWLRPYHVLSTGQQFRVTMARLLAMAIGRQGLTKVLNGTPQTQPVVVDEFTSVVDRTVAQVASHAIQKAVRERSLQFVAVTCHEDVEPWLRPDWVYRPAELEFSRRSLQRRPAIEIRLVRCDPSAWTLFAPHHYLSSALVRSAYCFLAEWKGQPVAFSAWLPFIGTGMAVRREHRTVCLPDYQGVGIGNAVSDAVASMWRGLGFKARSTTTHPAMIASRRRSPHWRTIREPSLAVSSEGQLKHATTRMTASFEYIGPKMNKQIARMLHGR